jgi:hypothetical protein
MWSDLERPARSATYLNEAAAGALNKAADHDLLRGSGRDDFAPVRAGAVQNNKTRSVAVRPAAIDSGVGSFAISATALWSGSVDWAAYSNWAARPHR